MGRGRARGDREGGGGGASNAVIIARKGGGEQREPGQIGRTRDPHLLADVLGGQARGEHRLHRRLGRGHRRYRRGHRRSRRVAAAARAGRSEGASSDTQTIRQSSTGRSSAAEVGTSQHSAPSSSSVSRGVRRIRVLSVPSPGLVAARRRTHPARTRGRSSRVPMDGDVEMSAVRLTTSAREEESDGACLFARPFDPAAPASSRRVLPARSPSTPRPTLPVPLPRAQAASRASRSPLPARVAPAAARPPRRRRPSPFRRTPPSFASSPPPRSSPTSS